MSNDSQSVVKQIEDSYEARGEKLILYLKKVRELFKKFIRVQVKHVPRTENSRAYALAKLVTTSQEDLGKLIHVEHLLEPHSKHQQRRSLPCDVGTELDGPHLGLLGGRYIAKQPKGGIQTQGKVGKINCSSRNPL